MPDGVIAATGRASSRATAFASSLAPAVSNVVAGTQEGAPKLNLNGVRRPSRIM